MKSPINIPNDLDGGGLHSQLLELLRVRFNKFYIKNQEIIDDYLYLKAKLDELEYRLNFQYRLNVFNSKTSGKIISAKVKFPFMPQQDGKSNYPYFNLHIGKISDYKDGIDDPQVRVNAVAKIKSYIDSKYPFIIKNIDNQDVIFYFKGGY
jgi:hypothetical protein